MDQLAIANSVYLDRCVLLWKDDIVSRMDFDFVSDCSIKNEGHVRIWRKRVAVECENLVKGG